ncbi:hypothetical protein BmR1_04g09212 [Babesia microti strain RI]|uniref:Checkpoint protein n=1 Tax=Babesia microti (strain RI) TaxID=1133968 RepID=A0A1N6LYD1_BABMR|nr:hypothetical protein BmR1_04g09212 [Babesia microti strain RI]SIO73877.1 hypothetical protein BmR1_04g09212 [Babesia microti strain RI]|eukprot:XP_021337929.1 hypothetical protein BmR1_04g09212 [Babesia microti strain RI]
MELKCDFRVEYLRHFSNCISSLSRLSLASKSDTHSYVNFTPTKVYANSRNLHGLEGYTEIPTNNIFHENPVIINKTIEGNPVFLKLDIVRFNNVLSAASTSDRVAIELIVRSGLLYIIVSFDDMYHSNKDIPVESLPAEMLDGCITPDIPLYKWNVALPKICKIISFLDAAFKLGSEFVDISVCKMDSVKANLTLIADTVMVNLESSFNGLKLFMGDEPVDTNDNSSIVRTVNTKIFIQVMRALLNLTGERKTQCVVFATISDNFSEPWIFLVASCVAVEECRVYLTIPVVNDDF